MKNISRLFALASVVALCLFACARQTAVKNTNTQKPQEKPAQTQPTGSIEITSTPAGAQVILIEETEAGAGEPETRGATPTTVTVPPGKYTVHLEKNGYRFFQKQVAVKENQTVKVAATLRK
jgi:hypothetical protein